MAGYRHVGAMTISTDLNQSSKVWLEKQDPLVMKGGS
jgi:hypothetical protein